MSVSVVHFDVLAHLGAARDKTGRGGGMRPPANYSAKEKLGAQQLDSDWRKLRMWA